MVGNVTSTEVITTDGARAEPARLYSPPAARPELVEVPDFLFVAVDGRGDPNTSEEYRAAVRVLYAFSLGLRLSSSRNGGSDWQVRPLEGLWWQDEVARADSGRDPTRWVGNRYVREGWRWRLMIRQPEHLTDALVREALAAARAERWLTAADLLSLEWFHEGLSAQIMHVGPYASELPTLLRLDDFIATRGLVPTGRHHEIYLADPRRTAPERLRTVLRQPVSHRV
jgi:hypothetical protein